MLAVKNQKGFTLVEMLVTLSIMAVVMGAALVAFGGTRATARDGKRKADLESMRSALELYRSDNGGYPPAATWQSGLTSGGYMTTIPAEPGAPGRVYSYTPAGCGASVCSTYTLCAAVELGGGTVVGCGRWGGGCNYKTTNP